MKYLFVHDAFPGQFIHLLRHLHGQSGGEIMAASRKGSSLDLPIEQIIYDMPKSATGLGARQAASALGVDLFQKLAPYAKEGYRPDFILSHASSGAAMYLRDLFPDARFTSFLEWYYQNPPVTGAKNAQAFHRVTAANSARNGILAAEFDVADAAYAPTRFQRSQFPAKWQHFIEVCHEGIDTNKFKPNPTATFEVAGKTFSADDEIITYAARGMERTRGFPEFMKAVAEVQKQRPNTHVLIAGADRQCYDPGGRGKPGLKSWAERKVDYDPERTHFVGLIKEPQFIKMLQVSSVHIYASIPFVLSWSCLNAMSVGVPVIASDNAPVQEVITDGENGVLLDAADTPKLVQRINEVLDDRATAQQLGAAARDTIVRRFELAACVDRQLRLVQGT